MRNLADTCLSDKTGLKQFRIGNTILERLRAALCAKLALSSDHRIRAVLEMARALIIHPAEFAIIIESHFGRFILAAAASMALLRRWSSVFDYNLAFRKKGMTEKRGKSAATIVNLRTFSSMEKFFRVDTRNHVTLCDIDTRIRKLYQSHPRHPHAILTFMKWQRVNFVIFLSED